ncbi:MAG TPA: lysophospholipid acyltransferase family protein [Fluviicoccus sp.]|nr:lysophospholipid acyltransferase family protein [Fluviicoccus sp.]
MLLKTLERRLMPPDLKEAFAKARKPLGSLEYDRWGYHLPTSHVAAALTRPLYERYFRVESHGRENIPAQGRVLIVPNHSGYVPLDGSLIGYSMLTNPFGPRVPRAMIERFFPDIPWLGNFMNAIGAVVGEPHNCLDMLQQEEAVIVFPEGIRGAAKGFGRRYQLQRFGCGFMQIAIDTNTPIIPVGVVGCEEALPMFGNMEGLAKRLGLPYVAIAPPFPLPVKVSLHYGEPLYFSGPIHCEDDLEARVDVVRNKIRQLIQQGLDKRGQETSV